MNNKRTERKKESPGIQPNNIHNVQAAVHISRNNICISLSEVRKSRHFPSGFYNSEVEFGS